MLEKVKIQKTAPKEKNKHTIMQLKLNQIIFQTDEGKEFFNSCNPFPFNLINLLPLPYIF